MASRKVKGFDKLSTTFPLPDGWTLLLFHEAPGGVMLMHPDTQVELYYRFNDSWDRNAILNKLDNIAERTEYGK